MMLKAKPYRDEWIKNNQDKINEWRIKNKDKLRVYGLEYAKEYNKQMRILNPLKVRDDRRRRFYRQYYDRSVEEVTELKKNGCALCGYTKILDMVCLHHKDKNPKNNNASNFIPLCASCHYGVHKGYISLNI